MGVSLVLAVVGAGYFTLIISLIVDCQKAGIQKVGGRGVCVVVVVVCAVVVCMWSWCVCRRVACVAAARVWSCWHWAAVVCGWGGRAHPAPPSTIDSASQSRSSTSLSTIRGVEPTKYTQLPIDVEMHHTQMSV